MIKYSGWIESCEKIAASLVSFLIKLVVVVCVNINGKSKAV